MKIISFYASFITSVLIISSLSMVARADNSPEKQIDLSKPQQNLIITACGGSQQFCENQYYQCFATCEKMFVNQNECKAGCSKQHDSCVKGC
jgi:hypothetical protein